MVDFKLAQAALGVAIPVRERVQSSTQHDIPPDAALYRGLQVILGIPAAQRP
jgi:hypothetical protein